MGVMAEQIEAEALVMPVVAFEEVEHKTPDCAQWLKEHKLLRLDMTNDILQEAIRIKELVGVVNDRYHSKGVGENDLLIIATVKVHGVELVPDEKRQLAPLNEPTKRKIPAVCNMPAVSVSCVNFLEYLKRSGAVFR